MRFLGISNLSIQTAGYSGQAMPLILIEAIEHAGRLRELIRSMVRGSPARDDAEQHRLTRERQSCRSADPRCTDTYPDSPGEALKPARSSDALRSFSL